MLHEWRICSHLFVLRHPTGIPCTHQVADLRVCGFIFYVCQIRWNATHLNIPSWPPRSILRSHFAHQSRDRILRDSDGRTWSWPLANLVDKYPRTGYGFQSEPLPLCKAGNMFVPAGLVWIWLRPIRHRDLWNSNHRKIQCIFLWNLQIIEVFANEFAVFRIYSIFGDVSEPTNFRFFWIVRFKNNHTCDPLFLIMYA